MWHCGNHLDGSPLFLFLFLWQETGLLRLLYSLIRANKRIDVTRGCRVRWLPSFARAPALGFKPLEAFGFIVFKIIGIFFAPDAHALMLTLFLALRIGANFLTRRIFIRREGGVTNIAEAVFHGLHADEVILSD